MWNKVKLATKDGQWSIVVIGLLVIYKRYCSSRLGINHILLATIGALVIVAGEVYEYGHSHLFIELYILTYLAGSVLFIIGKRIWYISFRLYNKVKDQMVSFETDIEEYKPKRKSKNLTIKGHGEFEVVEPDDVPEVEKLVSKNHNF
jgi:hypothetical protein